MRKLGLDLGSKTCGISISDDNNTFALGLVNFHYADNNMMLIIHQIKKILNEYSDDVDEFILGYPYNYKNNNSNDSCVRIDKFKQILNTNFPNIKVIYVDENYSTIKASSMLFDSQIKASKRKKVIDMISSIMILQDYLNTLKDNSSNISE